MLHDRSAASFDEVHALRDTKNMFGFQHVAPVLSKTLVSENGSKLHVDRQQGDVAADRQGDGRAEQGRDRRQEVAGEGRERLPEGERAEVVPLRRSCCDVHAGLVAVAAACLVLLRRADHDRVAGVRRRPAVDEPLRRRRRSAAAVADGLQLVDELGMRQQNGHRPERLAPEVLVEPCRHDARAGLRRGPAPSARPTARRTGPRRSRRPRTPARGPTSSATEPTGTPRIRTPAWLTTSTASKRSSTRGLKMTTRWPAISARRSRRIISSLLPLNIGPQTTSSQPP